MTAIELLTDLQRQGFSLTLLPEGKLAVRPAEKLTDTLREQLRQRKAELLAVLTQPARPEPTLYPVWPCEHCGQPAEIEAVGPSLNGQRTLTFWNCQPVPDVGSDAQHHTRTARVDEQEGAVRRNTVRRERDRKKKAKASPGSGSHLLSPHNAEGSYFAPATS